MGFPVPCAGVLPRLLLTAFITVAALRELCHSLLHLLGLHDEAVDYHSDAEPFNSMHDDDAHAHADAWLSYPSNDSLQEAQSRYAAVTTPLSTPPGTSAYTTPLILLQGAVVHDDDKEEEEEEEEEDASAQCSVCLCKPRPGQELRHLPRCGHVFHRDCLHGWLHRGHKSCPLCRTPLILQAMNGSSNY